MNEKRIYGLWALTAVAMLAAGGLLITTMSGCGGGSGKVLSGGGSTFVAPMMREWSDTYEKEKGIKINYTEGGSGNGIQQMTAKMYIFGCTDAPMNAKELEAAKKEGGEVVHIPLVIGAVVPAYNLKDAKEPIKFTGPVLADIYLGAIKKWNDDALVRLNPNAALPDKKIVVVHRSEPSGTTFIWTDYLSKVSPEWKEKVKSGKEVTWPVGEGQKGTDGVANLVGATDGAIGYVEVLYALNNKDKISFGSVRNADGEDVLADKMEGLTAAAESAEIPDDLCVNLTNAPGKKSYPICSAVWAVAYAKQPADKGKMLVDFLKWATHDGQKHADGLHYAALPKALIDKVDKKLETIKVGE